MPSADLSIRDVNGTVFTSGTQIFSGAVEIGSGVYDGYFRVYNNYDANPGVAHVKNVKVFVSAISGTVGVTENIFDPYKSVRTNMQVRNQLSGICTAAHMADGAAPSGAGWQNINSGIQDATPILSNRTFDVIKASGTYNYNEYKLQGQFSGTETLDTTSGTLYIHVEYEEWADFS